MDKSVDVRTLETSWIPWVDRITNTCENNEHFSVFNKVVEELKDAYIDYKQMNDVEFDRNDNEVLANVEKHIKRTSMESCNAFGSYNDVSFYKNI